MYSIGKKVKIAREGQMPFLCREKTTSKLDIAR